jgi:hypothetical protein
VLGGRTASSGTLKLAGLVMSARKETRLRVSCGAARGMHRKCVGLALGGIANVSCEETRKGMVLS